MGGLQRLRVQFPSRKILGFKTDDWEEVLVAHIVKLFVDDVGNVGEAVLVRDGDRSIASLQERGRRFISRLLHSRWGMIRSAAGSRDGYGCGSSFPRGSLWSSIGGVGFSVY